MNRLLSYTLLGLALASCSSKNNEPQTPMVLEDKALYCIKQIEECDPTSEQAHYRIEFGYDMLYRPIEMKEYWPLSPKANLALKSTLKYTDGRIEATSNQHDHQDNPKLTAPTEYIFTLGDKGHVQHLKHTIHFANGAEVREDKLFVYNASGEQMSYTKLGLQTVENQWANSNLMLVKQYQYGEEPKQEESRLSITYTQYSNKVYPELNLYLTKNLIGDDVRLLIADKLGLRSQFLPASTDYTYRDTQDHDVSTYTYKMDDKGRPTEIVERRVDESNKESTLIHRISYLK